MVCEWRIDKLKTLRANPAKWVPIYSQVYRDDPAQFIIDWGMTADPRNIDRGLPAALPFLLFPHQEEMIHEIMDCWFKNENLLIEKTREMGASWIAIALACTLCNFRNGMTIGFGAALAEQVDKTDNPKSLFWKGRQFMSGLPVELIGGWSRDPRRKPRPWNPFKDAPQMRISFPHTNSQITGEAGRQIGRGGRASLFFVDESAHIEDPMSIEYSLSQTTRCRIDISTPCGMANPFAQKRHSGKVRVFTFHWSKDDRKDAAWYKKQLETLDPLVIAQEIDIDYSGSVEGRLIPAAWFEASIDAHKHLGIEITGKRTAGFDVADEGIDKNCFAGRYGILLEVLDEWSGVGSDIFKSVERVFGLCDLHGYDNFIYDADGLGAGCRGDARVINERRAAQCLDVVNHRPFQGSGKVWRPDDPVKLGTDPKERSARTNKDFYANLKAQSWWHLRLRFQATARARDGMPYNPADIISISSDLKLLSTLRLQMQQPTYSYNGTGHVLIDKMPDGMRSPNQSDAVMIAFNPALSAGDAWLKMAAR